MALILDRTEQLFPLPLWRFRIDERDLNPLLIDEIGLRRQSEAGLDPVNRSGWQSEHDLFRRPEPGHQRLAQIATDAMTRALSSIADTAGPRPFEPTLNGWINVNPPSGFNAPHQHPHAVLSGVYYIDVPPAASEKGGAIEWVSPHPVRHIGQMLKTEMTTEKRSVSPAAGELVIFPSQVLHWVYPNDSGRDRVTAAFNLALRPVKAAPGGARPRS